MSEDPLGSLDPERLWLVVIGPGSGECVMVRVPDGPADGQWLVVDACTMPGERARAGRRAPLPPGRRILEERGETWSLAVLSHPHQDHADGFDAWLDMTPSGRVGCAAPRLGGAYAWTSSPDPQRIRRGAKVEASLAAIQSRWEAKPGQRWEPRRGDSRRLGSAQIYVLHPDASAIEDFEGKGNPNDAATALLVQWEEARIVLGSDVELAHWESIGAQCPRLREHALLKVPHHGSSGAMVPAVFQAPQWEAGLPIWVLTPFNRGQKLPRFEDGEGAALMLDHVESLLMTALPVAAGDQATSPIETTRQALRDGQRFGGEVEQRSAEGGTLWIRWRSTAARPFPRHIWVFTLDADGKVERTPRRVHARSPKGRSGRSWAEARRPDRLPP